MDGKIKSNGSPLDYVREGRRLGKGPGASYTPAELQQRAVDYFEFMRDRVVNRYDAVKSGDWAGRLFAIPAISPLDLKAFLLFAGFGPTTWEKLRKSPDYAGVCEWIEMIIETQNFEGATTGLYNANLIARRHKIADRVDSDANVKVDGIAASPLNDLSLEQLEAIEAIVNGKTNK